MLFHLRCWGGRTSWVHFQMYILVSKENDEGDYLHIDL